MIFSKRQIVDLRSEGVDVIEYYLESRTNGFYLLREIFRLRSFVREIVPDIVHAHYGTMTSFIGSFSGAKKFAITFHGSDLNYVKSEFYLKEVLAKWLSQLSILKADAIFCVSKGLQQKLWWRRHISVVIPFGVNTEKFYPMDKSEAMNRLNIPLESRLVLFNNSAAVKRYDLALEAVNRLKKSIPNVELYPLSGAVEYETMLLLLNACDCLLICSDSEGSPVMVKEAMACNLPIVATDVGDVVDVLSGSFPSAVSEQIPEQLASAIREVMKDGIRSNGRQVIATKSLDSKGITARVVEVYLNIVKPTHND
jgi:glycosyltransferase involved in cell wall biosynthesis